MTSRGGAGLLRVAALLALAGPSALAGCGTGGPAAPSSAVQADATPGATRAVPAVAKDQRFAFDEIAQFPDGVEFEMAGATASKAESTQRGAERTNGELVTVSIRIGNFTELAYDTGKARVYATSGDDVPAPLVLDTIGELQSRFTGTVAPSDETVAPFGFAIPFADLSRVTFVVDPGDGKHEAVSFTGAVPRP